jgi:hypothetical protein
VPPEYRGGPNPPWRQRKRAYLERLRDAAFGGRAGSHGLRVSLADKLDNARSIVSDHHVIGDKVFTRFNAGKADQLWYYGELSGAFRAAGMSGRLLDELERTVAELQRLVGSGGDGATHSRRRRTRS